MADLTIAEAVLWIAIARELAAPLNDRERLEKLERLLRDDVCRRIGIARTSDGVLLDYGEQAWGKDLRAAIDAAKEKS